MKKLFKEEVLEYLNRFETSKKNASYGLRKVTPVELADLTCDLNLMYYTTVYARGYMNRTNFNYFYVEYYEGLCGKGVKVHIECHESTRYHQVNYYVKKGE